MMLSHLLHKRHNLLSLDNVVLPSIVLSIGIDVSLGQVVSKAGDRRHKTGDKVLSCLQVSTCLLPRS